MIRLTSFRRRIHELLNFPKTCKPFICSQSGSLTIESSLVFPVIFLITAGIIFFGIYVYQHVSLYSAASSAAERTAYTWDNSYKNPVTGDFYPGQQDGLYWHWLQDGAWDWLRLFAGNRIHSVQLDSGSDAERQDGNLIRKKLLHTKRLIPSGISGEAEYDNSLVERHVTVRLSSPFHVPSVLQWLIGWKEISAESAASVTEPAEFIRIADLLRENARKFLDEAGIENIREAYGKFGDLQGTAASEASLAFESHAQAKAYLQKLVYGRQSTRTTDEVGTWRLIDALDANMIAHQAYIGYKDSTKDLRDQLQKDAELLRNSKLNGVVWHFFKRKSDGSIGPSEKLRKQLEQNGIIVVIHELN
ncbi:TadE family protein [Ferviditalea candida]|uniref:TadE family protein n=1 Tax=Ferviditalea candida TaxID=3108399 RepID=A0ABU5ZJJ4_9BACL|nr:TadE family protein [Paenibacillaceae bacterium T2]